MSFWDFWTEWVVQFLVLPCLQIFKYTLLDGELKLLQGEVRSRVGVAGGPEQGTDFSLCAKNSISQPGL